MSEEQKDIPVNGAQEQPTPMEESPETLENGAQTLGDAGLQARIAQLEQESEDYRDKWLRAVADYKNFKRRADQERIELIRGASAGLLLKLLPVVDDFDRAAASAPAEITGLSWFDGFRLIAQKLQTILESEGVAPIEALGQEFDPNQHEAVIYAEVGDGADGKVVAELQKGYKLRDRVLRPTMVKVGKA
jgi:molecular chaperone GrpE